MINMTRLALTLGTLSTMLALPAISAAGLFFNGTNDYSAEADSSPRGRIDAETDLLTSDLYINSLSLTGGTFASSGLSLDTAGARFTQFDGGDNFVGYIDYSFGDTLASGFKYQSTGIFSGLFGFTGQGTTGTYTGSVDILGGANSSAADVLATVNFTLEIVSSYGLTITYPVNTITVGPGQQAVLQNRVVNSSDRDFLVNSRYVSLYNNPIGFTLDFDGTYPSTFAANSDVTVDSLRFTGGNGGPIWTGLSNGVIGGLFVDDYSTLPGGGQFTVNPVPEPASLAILGLGGLALARRRQRKN